MGMYTTDHGIVFENSYAIICISREDSRVERIYDKVHGAEIKGGDTCFFSLVAQDQQTVILPTGLQCDDKEITVETPLGSFRVAVAIDDAYFTFELADALPEAAYKGIIAHAKYAYDVSDKTNTGAVGIAMSYWTNPCFYPDAKDRETKAEVMVSLRSEGAKYALIIAPIVEHKELIKRVCRTIDKEKGIVTECGGPWGRDAQKNCGNYMLETDLSLEHIKKRLSLYHALGLDQVDIHQWFTTFRQGDFKYAYYESPADFKKNVVELLNANGFGVSLHTYAHYIRYDCDPILADPKWQRDLAVLETVTLAEDIDENAEFIPAVESTEDISNQDGFLSPNTPFILIGEELIRFEMDAHGFKVAQRGVAGTKPAAHRKGAPIKHIEGLFRMIAPVLGSELFLKIARDTAKAYNEGGYEMLYIDALDGINNQCRRDDDRTSYYVAQFAHEILKHCDTTPIFECSIRRPSLWLARGRIGNFDTPHRGYKRWNKEFHMTMNRGFLDMYMQPSLGWYWFYPTDDRYPGNLHTKYQHTDMVEYIGALAAMHNFNMVYVDMEASKNDMCRAFDRNIAIYRRCDELRKAGYFSEETLQKVRTGDWEYHIVQKDDGRYVFVQKDYQIKKYYDLCDAQRNQKSYRNPFASQNPFVRIEALLSARETELKVLLEVDKEKDVAQQELKKMFDGSIDLSSKLAKKVSIRGNGKAGAVIIQMWAGITTQKAYAEYIIDTDFEGWRDFVLAETDNGERQDIDFTSGENVYSIYRYDFDHEHTTGIGVSTVGDTAGVKMSDIVAVEHMYEVLKAPTIQVGDSRVTFACELMSTDFIEFDGENAKVIDRYGNERSVRYTGQLTVPEGSFEAELTAKPINGGTARAQLTFGFTGAEIV